MAISVHCASCGQAYSVNEQLAGRLLRCRRCGAAIQAPAADPACTLAPPTYQAEAIYSQQSAYPASPDLGGGYLAPARPAPLPRNRRRRKQSSGVLLWVATAGGTLFALAIIAAIIVASGQGPEGWITLLTAPSRERNKVRPITAPAEDPFAKTRKPQPAPAPSSLPPYTGPSPEPTLQKMLAVVHRMNAALAAIHDEASAHQRQGEVVAGIREIGQLVQSGALYAPDLPIEESRRLKTTYEPQFTAAGEQLKREGQRIAQIPGARQVMARALQFEDVNLQIAKSFATARHIGAQATRRTNQIMRTHMGALTAPSSLEKIDPFARFPEREVVEIVVQQLPAEGMQSVSQRLREISNCQAWRGTGNGESARFTIAPIRDFRALAAKIDFGEVTVLHVSQSLIVVEAEASKIAGLPPPAPPPPPLAPPRQQASDSRDPAFYRRNLEDLSNSDPGYRHAAALRLQSAEPKELRAEIAQAFIKLLGDSDKSLRHLAVQALPVWATADEAVPLLIELLSDSDDGLVDRAIKALAEFKDVRAAGPLCERANRFGFQVHDALRKLGTSAEPEVIKHLRHSDEAVRKTAIKALGDIGTSRCVPFLQELAKCGDFFVEVEAKNALEQVHRRRY